jgi:hypothetical protein
MIRRNAARRDLPPVEAGSVTDKFQREFLQHNHVLMKEFQDSHEELMKKQNEAVIEAQKWTMYGGIAFGLSALIGVFVKCARDKR